MKISIVQLSDIHFKSPGDNFLLGRLDKIVAAIVNLAKDSDLCLLLITGDIVFSGKKEEYEIAQKFFDDLCSKLTMSMQNVEITPVFIPGNHDCDFSTENNIRNMLLPQISIDQKLPDDVLAQMMSVQANYFDFVSHWSKNDFVQLSDGLYKIVQIQLFGKIIEL